VYRAKDTVLGREVAVRCCRGLLGDAERVARFSREAQALAALSIRTSRPSTDSNSQRGARAGVELVEGPTLAERIAKGRLPVDEALGVARQIAEALGGGAREGDRASGPEAGQREDPSGWAGEGARFRVAKALDREAPPALDRRNRRR